MECPYKECKSSLKPWNAATNFSNPVLSVKYAADTGMIRSHQLLLEFGAGNLRNTLYLMRTMRNIEYYVVENVEVVRRFHDKYAEFKNQGGHLIEDRIDMDNFDIIICTFVLEIICPLSERLETLQLLARSLRYDGHLVASFRGYPGVKGSKYKQCPAGEGFITPLSTFIKPFSIKEAEQLLEEAGFTNFVTLQKYRVDKPQNIHVTVGLGKQQ